jgi:phosphatidylglycerol:prolipoprotein diacylglycerol transferase
MYPPFPPGFQLGPLTIHWYGIIMVTAIFVCALIASRYVARRGQDSNNIWNMLLWVVVPAIIGARLYYVFIQSPRGPDGLDSYLAHPLEILAIWQGGIHIYGALIGGGIALLIYVYVKKLPALIYLDAVGLGLLLSQAIGRLGNFMNQELYGPPTTLPWGLRIDPASRLAPYNNLALYPESTRFQPLFLYEMIWNLIGFALIFWLARRFEKKLRDGDIVLLYLIWYPLGRFFLEFFRTDSWFFPGTPFDLVHLLSVIVIVASIALLIIRHRNWSGRSVVAMPQGSSVALPDDEEEVVAGNGIDMREEYTFMGRHRQAAIEAQDAEELIQEEMLADEVAQEESEGIEDIEDWDGEDLEEEMLLEEEEEYVEEESTLGDPEEEIKKAKEEKPEEELKEEEEEEPEEENEEGVVGEEEGETEEEEEEAVEGGEETEEGGEEVAEGEEETEESGEEVEESGTGEGDAEDETAGAKENSEGGDEGDAGDASDE